MKEMRVNKLLWEVRYGGVVDRPYVEQPRFWEALNASQKEKWISAAFKAAYGSRVKILKRGAVFAVPYSYYGAFTKGQLLAKYTADMASFASKEKAKAKKTKAKTKTTKRKAGRKMLPPRK